MTDSPFFALTPVATAVDRVTEALKKALPQDSEWLGLDRACGRLLAQDLTAAADVPNYRKSTVDGFAVRAPDTEGAGPALPAILRLAGEIQMGEKVEQELLPGNTLKIPTGGMLPPGADAVVMLEDSECLQAEVLLYRPVAAGSHTIDVGEDLARGSTVLRAGSRIGPHAVGALAALGIREISVYRKPRFALLSTGDEIRGQGERLEIGQVYDSNAQVLAALIGRLGGQVSWREIVGDDPALLQKAVRRAVSEADVVLLSGGSSVGERDYTKETILSLPDSQLLVHGLAAKPGKPTLAATSGRTLLLGLPGHPASCALIFQALFFPAFYRLGRIGPGPAPLSARLLENCHGAPGRLVFQTVQLDRDADGQRTCRPLRGPSGLVSLLASGGGFFLIDADEEGVRAGSAVQVYSLEGGFVD